VTVGSERRGSRARQQVRLRDVLSVREYRGMLLAQLASEAGDQIARVALALLVLSHTGSPLLAATTFAISIVPGFVGSALLGPIADRFSRRALMLGADFVRAVIVAILALMAVPGTPLWVLFALLLLAEFATPLFASARAATTPEVLGTAGLVTYGSAVSSSLSMANQAIGLVAGGIIVQVTSPRSALFLDAVSFAVSFVILVLYLRPRPATLEATQSILVILGDLRRGWTVLMADRSRRSLVMLAWGMSLPLVAPEAVGLAYTRGQGLGDSWGGLLMAGVVTGAAAGALLVGRRRPRDQIELVLPMAIAMSLPLLVTGLEPNIVIVLVLWTLSGMAQAFLVPVMTFTTLLTANEQRGAVVGIAGSLFGLLTASGYLVTGWIATVTSPAFAVVLMAVVGLAVVSVCFITWPGRELRDAVVRLESSSF